MRIQINGEDVGLALPEAYNTAEYMNLIGQFVPLQNWAQNIDENLQVHNVEVQSIDLFGPRIGFMKIKAEVTNKALGVRVPGIVFLRGDAVAVLPIIKSERSVLVLLTEEYRAPVGKRVLEIPAGMCDGSGNLSGIAIKELEEETGLKLNTSQLTSMGSFLPSVGGCDERVHLFLLEHTISEEEMSAMVQRTYGENECEVIRLKFLSIEDAMMLEDSKTLIALFRYKCMKELGK